VVRFPSQTISPASAAVDAGENLHQGRLACAVLARRPTTSPGPTEKLTSSRARTPGKDLDTCRISRRGRPRQALLFGAVQNSREHDDDPDDRGLPVRGDRISTSPFLMTPMMQAPMSTPSTLPEPPRARVPPITAAAIASRLPALPCVGLRGS